MTYNTNIKDAAQQLGITPRAVHKRIASGTLIAQKTNNHWLVDDESLLAAQKNTPKAGRKRKGTTYLLMNRKYPVMEFSFDETDCSFLPREVLDSTRAPLGTVTRSGKGNALGLKSWWEHRCIPEGRTGMDSKLATLGVADASLIPFRNLGFSLSDQYWIQPEGENLAWDELNYFHNSFGNANGAWDNWLDEVGLSSPDNTSEGVLPKKWIHEGSDRILLKGHNPWTDQQVYNEAVATALYRRVLDAHDYVPYEVRNINGLGVVSACTCFLRDDEEYVPASLVHETETTKHNETIYQAIVRKACNLGIPRHEVELSLSKMVVCDSILANSDRHLRNFGFIRNVETLTWRMAPLFDNGNSLWFDKDESMVAKGDYSFMSRPFDPNPARQLLLSLENAWFDLDLLDGFPQEAIEILGNGNISQGRTEYLERGIEQRIQALKIIWA